jgi:hypothetical protein
MSHIRRTHQHGRSLTAIVRETGGEIRWTVGELHGPTPRQGAHNQTARTVRQGFYTLGKVALTLTAIFGLAKALLPTERPPAAMQTPNGPIAGVPQPSGVSRRRRYRHLAPASVCRPRHLCRHCQWSGGHPSPWH